LKAMNVYSMMPCTVKSESLCNTDSSLAPGRLRIAIAWLISGRRLCRTFALKTIVIFSKVPTWFLRPLALQATHQRPAKVDKYH